MSSQESVRLGWIGLGSMGLAMATNIQKHLKEKSLPSLRYWNRTISRGKPLEESGCVRCQSPTKLLQDCDVIFTSVSDDEALQTLRTTLPTHPSITNKILVDTTTVHPSTTAAITTQLKTVPAIYIEGPVFGSTPVAQAGQILIALAGPADAIATIKPYLQGVLARAIMVVGKRA